MKRIKIVVYVTICVFAYLLIAQNASAHVLQTDGTIGAVMHIDPNDDPIAGQQAGLFFTFKDTTDKFDAKNCDCKIAILESGKTMYAQPLFPNTSTPPLDNASLFYTFPSPNVYQVVITGTPTSKNAFQSFKLVYAVRVEKPQGLDQNANSSTNFFITHFGQFIAGILLLLVVSIVALRNYHHHGNIFPKPQK